MDMNNNHKKNIDDIHNLIKTLNGNPKKILLSSDLYDWLLCSNWDCILSEKLKSYIAKDGIVKRIKRGD